MSEEFGGALPTDVIAEARRLPVGMLETIIEDRAIVRAIARHEADPEAPGDLVALVRAVDFELAAEAIARKQQTG